MPRHRQGFTLVELLLVITLAAIMMRLGAIGVRALATQQGGERVARSMLWELQVARTYAIRAGQPVSLVADKTNRRLITRNAFGEVYRSTPFGAGTDLVATSLSTNIAGDSIAFSGRGHCLNCATAGTSAFSVVSRGRTYSMTINTLGRAELLGLPNF
jgi:type II secretion system protein H